MCFIHLDEHEAPILWKPVNTKLTTFHPFPRLAVELRLTIWSLVPDARVVEVVRNNYSAPITGFYCTQESKHPASGLLRANQESRWQYMQEWFPLYLEPKLTTASPKSSRNVVYFNPKLDTLYISQDFSSQQGIEQSNYLPLLKTIKGLQDLRFLAINQSIWYFYSKHAKYATNDSAYHELWKDPYAYFPNLQQMAVAIGDELYDRTTHQERRPKGPIELHDELHYNSQVQNYAIMARHDYNNLDPSTSRPGIGSWTVKTITRGGGGAFQRIHRDWAEEFQG